MQDFVFAVERAFALSFGRAPVDAIDGAPVAAMELGRWRAALGAVASRFLAVGTPRSIGLVVDDLEDARRSLAAHATWFAPRDIRIACAGEVPADLGRAVTRDEALAADIACVHARGVTIAATQLRRGTHVNVLADDATIEPALLARATVARVVPTLGEMAAGLIDGRQLDEITIFTV